MIISDVFVVKSREKGAYLNPSASFRAGPTLSKPVKQSLVKISCLERGKGGKV
jgi:hypothetical protein